MIDVLALHRDLVAIPSVSGNEKDIADYLTSFLDAHGANPQRIENSVLSTTGEGKHLVLNSHIDTVPPSDSWNEDPWNVSVADGKVTGLGANDAKASVAALVAAYLSMRESCANLCISLLLAQEEETSGAGTQAGLAHLASLGQNVDFALIGEPTGLQSGIGQYGLLIAALTTSGDSCHSANAESLGAKNAVFGLALDLAALLGLDLSGSTLQPTILSAGTVHNQLPKTASAILDIRLSPEADEADILESIRSVISGDLKVKSNRLKPYYCPENSPLLACVPKPNFLSRTMSDQVFFRGISAVKIGPGDSNRSHTTDEFVYESEILAGVETYKSIIAKLNEVCL